MKHVHLYNDIVKSNKIIKEEVLLVKAEQKTIQMKYETAKKQLSEKVRLF